MTPPLYLLLAITYAHGQFQHAVIGEPTGHQNA